MQSLDNLAFWQWFIQVLFVFFLVGGLAGIAVGAGLYLSSSRTLAFFSTVNRYTSMRRSIKPLETPHDTIPTVQKYIRVIAAVFVVGGAYSLYALLVQYDAAAIAYILKLSKPHPLASGLVIDSIRWVLIAGNLAAVAIGIMMFVDPAKLGRIEARGSKWFSDRTVTQVGDRMHTPLDRWVAASPRAAGLILGVGSLVVVVSAVVMLVMQR